MLVVRDLNMHSIVLGSLRFVPIITRPVIYEMKMVAHKSYIPDFSSSVESYPQPGATQYYCDLAD